MATYSPNASMSENTRKDDTNERTRIVHFTNTRKQMILSPTQTHSRLPSSCSLSSLVSEDKAPLASFELERDHSSSSSRRSSVKSKDGNMCNTRSLSTGRMLDESRLSKLIFESMESRDRPTPSMNGRVDDRGENFGDATPTNSSFPMEFFMSGSLKSTNSEMDERMYRNTLGSWSRSRRKPQIEQDTITTSFGNRFNSSTLPLKYNSRSVVTADTLVKSRKRYTWLSNKQTLSQGPIVPHSPKLSTNDSNHSGISTHTPNKSPRTASSNAPTYYSSVSQTTTNSHISPSISTKREQTSQKLLPNKDRNLNSSMSPKSHQKLEEMCAQKYNWKNDPRRRPCNFGDNVFGKDQSLVSSDQDASFSESVYSNDESGIGQYTPKPTVKVDSSLESGFSSYASPVSVTGKCSDSPVSLPRNSSPRWSPSKGVKKNRKNEKDSSFISYKATTPVDDIDDDVISSKFSKSSSNSSQDYSQTITDSSFIDNLYCAQQDNTQTKNNHSMEKYLSPINANPNVSYCSSGRYRDCLVRESLSFNKNEKEHSHGSNIMSHYKPNHPNTSFVGTNSGTRDELNVTASDNKTICSGDEVWSEDKSPEEILKSPRSRASFQLAVGSNWDLMPEKEVACSKLPLISESPHNSPKKQLDNSLEKSHLDDVFTHSSPDWASISLTGKIKRNSMRLATASVSDISCTLDSIDINELHGDNEISPSTFSLKTPTDDRHSPSCDPPPMTSNKTLQRTDSHNTSCSSYGSFYSCKSKYNSPKPSPNLSTRQEIRSRFESPYSLSRYLNQTKSNSVSAASSNNPAAHNNINSRSASPVSIASSGKSSQRHKPAYFWTRQAPYPRMMYGRSGSVASYSGPSLKGKPLIQSSSSCQAVRKSSSKGTTAFHSSQHSQITSFETQEPKTVSQKNYQSKHGLSQQQAHQSRMRQFADRRSLTLPLASFSSSTSSKSRPYHYTLNPPYQHQTDRYSNREYSPELSPTSVLELDLESPNNPVRSPPSLGRPRRKQYAGFDSQPLPMESYISDSSSVYTCLSCSSLATDATGHVNDSQLIHDSSFISDFDADRTQDDINVRLSDASFETSQTKITRQLSNISKNIKDTTEEEESESKRSSVHSESTTKQDNEDTEMEIDDDEGNLGDDEDPDNHNDKRFDDDLSGSNDDFINSKQGRQLESGYQALFRLYKSDDLFTTPSCPIFSQDGKAFSSSCLLRSQLYSKRKFLSDRDLFELMQNPDKAHRFDMTVSLTSLERQAHKVCEAILCSDGINSGYLNRQSII